MAFSTFAWATAVKRGSIRPRVRNWICMVISSAMQVADRRFGCDVVSLALYPLLSIARCFSVDLLGWESVSCVGL